MFTGATPEAGKSFIAVNLAVLHAEVGARVLLIDADMRRGQLASLFNENNRGGLSEVLKGEVQPSDVIRKVGIEGLSFMSCGSHTANPAALLMRYRFKETLNLLSKQFDLIVMDTPPFLVVTDASIIASEAGSTVLVFRSGVQSEIEIADTVKKLERAEARIAGAVVNAIPLRRSNRDYSYDAYLQSAGQLDATS
jgi:tyrosine-protein kinase Etk/Wzc